MKAIIINKLDNVAVVVNDVPKGTTVITDAGEIIAKELIKTGHKIALCDIDKGQPIIKYGTIIGEASTEIKKGQWVHCHNVLDTTEKICDEYESYYRAKVKEAEEI